MAGSIPWWQTPPFTLRDHDVRIVRGRWIFYVRGVRVGEPFRGGVSGRGGSGWGGASDWEGFVLGLVLTPFIKGAAALFRSRGKTWKVGILRHRNVRWGGIIRVVYKERLAPGQAPNQRIAELVKVVNDGTFDK